MLESGEVTSGIYLLKPQGTNRLVQAWCEQSRAEGGWTVIQRRVDGSVNFFRTWEQYKVGWFLWCHGPFETSKKIWLKRSI